GQPRMEMMKMPKPVTGQRKNRVIRWLIPFLLAQAALGGEPHAGVCIPNLPDRLIVEAYRRAATQNVLAAVNPKVFPGYWSVCADGVGFGYGNTYPSLDGHQMTDALLFLGQYDVVKANWDYV